MEELGIEIIDYLKKNYQGLLAERYEVDENQENYEILNQAALFRKVILPGGEANTERMAEMLVNEFRTGKLGRISLERPSAEETKDETVEE